MSEIGENRAGGVAQVPELLLRIGRQCDFYFAGTRVAKKPGEGLSRRRGVIRTRAFYFSQKNRHRAIEQLTQFVVGVLAGSGVGQKSLVEHLAGARARL